MELAAIATAEGVSELRAALDQEFQFLRDEGYALGLRQAPLGDVTLVDLSVEGMHGDERPRLVERLAKALSGFIMQCMEPSVLEKLVRRNYAYFDAGERDLIVHKAGLHLAEGQPLASMYGPSILQRLRDCLEEGRPLNLDGFITFRLQDYVEDLEEAVDQAVDDFLVEREYKEFVRLLRYFVEAQEPRETAAHVLITGPRTFRIFDHRFEPIESDAVQELVIEMVDSEVSYEDVLVSALITVAPAHVVLHGPLHQLGRESLQTVENVFGAKLETCRGCKLCRSEGRSLRP